MPSGSLCDEAVLSAILADRMARIERVADCLGFGAGAPAELRSIARARSSVMRDVESVAQLHDALNWWRDPFPQGGA